MHDPSNESGKKPALRPKRVTAEDVAKKAGVSRSAVSRAFSPDAYLDAEKRKLILQTALDLGYRPNALAASLQGARTNLVGVIMGQINNPYDSAFAAELITALNATDRWPLMLSGSEALTTDLVLSVLRYPLDAVIIRGGSLSPAVLDSCVKFKVPLIVSGRVIDAPLTDCVSCDNAAGAALAANALLAKSRRRIGFLGGPAGLTSSKDRLDGFKNRLQQFNVPLSAIGNAEYAFEAGTRAARALVQDNQLDALFCANDALAIGALSGARNEMSLSVPQDLSIIGFDDIAISSWPEFQLTTIRNPLGETVSHILDLLGKRLSDPERPNEVRMVQPTLIQRGSH